MTGQPVQQAAPKAYANSLDAGDTIDAVHEIVQIEQPHQVQQPDDDTEPGCRQRHAKNRNRWQAADPEKPPASRNEMPQQAPARGDVAMVVHEADQRYQPPRTQQTDEHRWRNVTPPTQN
ncbi:hypothetical protein D3C80_1023000 [compost metagenome]